MYIDSIPFTESLMMAAKFVLAATEEVVEESSLLSPDQFAGYAVTALFTIINVLAAFFILKLFVFKPIIKMMRKCQEAMAAEISSTEENSKAASELLAEAKKKTDATHGEAAAILSEARVQAEKQADTIIANARAEASGIIERAEEEAKHTHDTMLEQMKDEVADLAVSIATKVIGSLADEAVLKEMSTAEVAKAIKTEGE
ncbi:MAG TPA: F0F1 ATP synthase subunit B [Bacillota bacterium]|nr:F0F1 ATP synthase subunit B [Bacillota bacterium]